MGGGGGGGGGTCYLSGSDQHMVGVTSLEVSIHAELVREHFETGTCFFTNVRIDWEYLYK